MSNKEIYQKTLVFSIRRLLWDILAFIILAGLSIGGYALTESLANKGLIGLGVGLIVGIILVVIALRYVSYTYKAGQIAMMTMAVTEGQLPQDVYGEGKRLVKERFATVSIYFAAVNIVKGIFQQIGRGIMAVGRAVGGDDGNTVASVISAVVQTVVAYLSDCCLGWIFYRKNENAAKATCEGAVLFFKHGKTLAKNMGRVFGIGLASLVVIGGAFTGIFMLIFSNMEDFFTVFSQEVMEAAQRMDTTASNIWSDPQMVMLICAIFAAVILWSLLHSVFVRPFVLAGVLKNYLISGMEDMPDESSFAMLDSKSEKFKKLHAQLA